MLDARRSQLEIILDVYRLCKCGICYGDCIGLSLTLEICVNAKQLVKLLSLPHGKTIQFTATKRRSDGDMKNSRFQAVPGCVCVWKMMQDVLIIPVEH